MYKNGELYTFHVLGSCIIFIHLRVRYENGKQLRVHKMENFFLTDNVAGPINRMQSSRLRFLMSSSEDMTRGSARILEVTNISYPSLSTHYLQNYPLGEAVDVSLSLYIINVLEVRNHVSVP